MTWHKLLFLLLCVSFSASAQNVLEAEKVKQFRIAYSVDSLLGNKSVDVAVKTIDSLCKAHNNDKELSGAIRVNFIDWVKYNSGPIATRNYILAFRLVSEPFYQKYLIYNHFRNI